MRQFRAFCCSAIARGSSGHSGVRQRTAPLSTASGLAGSESVFGAGIPDLHANIILSSTINSKLLRVTRAEKQLSTLFPEFFNGIQEFCNGRKHRLISRNSSMAGLNPSRGMLQMGSVARTRARLNTIHGRATCSRGLKRSRASLIRAPSSLAGPTAQAPSHLQA
jgi:hypothetical protein